MTDQDRGLEAQEGDRLPWLEAVDDEDQREGIGSGKLVAGVLIALLVIGFVIGGIFWLRQGGAADGNASEPGLIAAQDGAYKVKPDAPGGMQVAGRGDSSYAASEGADPNAPIDLSALPEAPVTGSKVTSADAATSAPRPAKPAPATVTPKPAQKVTTKIEDKAPALAAVAPPKPKPVATAVPAAPVGPGGAIQLGAFSSEAKASAAWKSLSGRYAYLASLSQSVTPVTTDSGTLYRLRAGAAGQASNLCARLRVAGESCAVVN